MGHFLTFAMVAPMASFGTLAVGERRDGGDRPARSAVLGLLGACLGLTREDEAGQNALAEGYGLAVLCHAPGRLLTDYHTAQTAPSRRNWRPATRKQELAEAPGELATILSRRDYRMGSWHLGALWVRGNEARWSLAEMREALQEPVFTPSLGRKSCPPGLPLAPELVEGASATEVLLARQKNGPESRMCNRFGLFRDQLAGRNARTETLVVLDAADAVEHGAGHAILRREMRRDQPLSRARWQFGLREEALLLCVGDAGL
ncbi:type I-E CRISPR-associated protein Cas5/CasD [Acetobacter senegalensis]|uniref:type I-E CRISPR-associated protein Cas5/CasD n=1 Tax=Acetobacter senegalensis TaxID=446692 RepID=UPI00128E4953|nr:type I-E CRISPR-associated protein Cas5/CasD [Acetobacter senegalensis]MCG4256759.1 type I-E CRISPR-associated protein Cas5/CasD [Acetobacter senegalensis]MCG4266680.1 type I-E CRISPR-associated protein Cas5/CasD [Acetobacter senegalensis]MPQ73137.1 type I-E CRISPR-associated protein Cas5/CasD [Acetobacter senegalensis]